MRAQVVILRPIVSTVLASAALAAAGPAWAQSEQDIVYEAEAVIQPLPGSAPQQIEREAESQPAPALAPTQATEEDPTGYEPGYEDEYLAQRHVESRIEHRGMRALEPMHHQAGYPPMRYAAPIPSGHPVGAPVYFPQAGYPGGGVQYPGGYEQDQFARDGWLEECRARYVGGDGRGERRGRTIGALVGAAAGGLIGNRAAGRGDRLLGTAIGAGVGGLAGAAAGSAIGGSSDSRESLDECEAFLIQHEAQWRQTNYGYGPVMLVPIMVPVEQRAVVREYVTEEWAEEEVMVTVPDKTVRRLAPAPKPVKTVPVKTKMIKSGR